MTAWYVWLKALHVASALVFVGSVLASAQILALAEQDGLTEASVVPLRRWERSVTTPAMLLVWSFGVVLAIDGQWFAAPWLQVKLVFVVLLSGIHGIQSGRLRRMAVMAPPPLFPPAIVVACAIVIAFLATAKP